MNTAYSPEQVYDTLFRKLGPGMTSAIAPRMASCMCSIQDDADYPSIQTALEDALLSASYAVLGRGMSYMREDRVPIRITTDDLPELADDLLGIMLAQQMPTRRRFMQLKSYALASGSLTALKALRTQYTSYQNDDEIAWIDRLLQDRCGD